MRDGRRHQKKLERQRRKRDERHHELQRRAQEAAEKTLEVASGHTYAMNVPSTSSSADVTAWPIVRAYVPVNDVWRATGLGVAGVVRRQPDGRHASAFFMLELFDHGLKGAFGKEGDTLDAIDGFLGELADGLPPFEVGPVELAAEFAWGARAFARSHGSEFPREIDRFFALLPRPERSSRDWVRSFVGPDGLTPAGLLKVVRENPQPDDLPEGKELMILTEATFSMTDAEKAIAALREAPDFAHEGRDGDVDAFALTRKHPGWNPLRVLGGRQAIGSVRAGSGKLVAEAKTLSLMARLIGRLRGTVGDGLHLEGCRWTGQNELLRSVSANSSSTPT